MDEHTNIPMGKKLDHKDSLKFIFAGNSTFTLKNPKTENRFTFNVKKHKTDDIFFVSALTGHEYSFIGSVRSGRNYKHSLKSKISKNATSVKAFDYVTRHLVTGDLVKSVEVWHSGKCGRCGRRLTVPESIDSGFGPECTKLV